MQRKTTEAGKRLTGLLAALPDATEAPICTPARQTELTAADVVDIAELIGIDFAMVPFSLQELQLGMEMELEHARFFGPADTDGADLVATGQAVLAHLHERPDFYTHLTTAHSPGDPPPAEYLVEEVGAD